MQLVNSWAQICGNIPRIVARATTNVLNCYKPSEMLVDSCSPTGLSCDGSITTKNMEKLRPKLGEIGDPQ